MRFSTLLLGVLFFLLGPLMVLMPRIMLVWPIVAALGLLPVLFINRHHLHLEISRRTGLWLAATFVYSFASVLWSPSPRALEMAAGLFAMGLSGAVLFLALPFIPEATRQKLLNYFAAGAILGLLLQLGETFLDHPLHRWYEHIPAGQAVAENVPKRVAALLALLIWPIAMLLETRKKRLWAGLGVVLFFLLCGFMTSRSALLGTFIGGVVMFFAYHQAALARWVLMALVGFAVLFTPPLMAVLPLAPASITGHLFDSAQHRMKIWELTARHVVEHPLFGNGIDASRGIQTTVASEAADYMPAGTSIISQHPHNVFLQMWLDLGLIGALLWGGLLMTLIDRTRFMPEESQPYVLATITCSLIMLSTSFSVLQAWWSGGHIAAACMLLFISYSFSRKAATSGTSAGGIA